MLINCTVFGAGKKPLEGLGLKSHVFGQNQSVNCDSWQLVIKYWPLIYGFDYVNNDVKQWPNNYIKINRNQKLIGLKNPFKT